MIKTLVFATNNAHKLEEVQAVVGGRFAIKSLSDIKCVEDIPETGNTFAENASQKSRFLLEKYGYDCFADDSGLEVNALGGEPGVFSARYSGSRDMEKNMDLLLQRLGNTSERKACFRTVISLQLNSREYLFEGVVWGTIGYERRGEKGFGYDPLFTPDGYDRTFAEMTAGEKNAISHRAVAVGKLTDFLLQNEGT